LKTSRSHLKIERVGSSLIEVAISGLFEVGQQGSLIEYHVGAMSHSYKLMLANTAYELVV
jgi:hypothetical protein